MAKIILEDLDFSWEQKQIDRAIYLWGEGFGVPDIAADFKRDLDEVFLLMLHLSREGKIKKRVGYFWGGKGKC